MLCAGGIKPPNGRGHPKGFIIRLDIETGQVISAHILNSMVVSCAESMDGKHLAAFLLDSSLVVLSAEKWETEHRVPKIDFFVSTLKYSPDDKLLVMGGDGAYGALIFAPVSDLPNLPEQQALPHFEDVVFLKEEHQYLLGTTDSISLRKNGVNHILWTKPVTRLGDVALSPDERLFATAGFAGDDLMIGDVASGRILYATSRSVPYSVAFSNNGKLLAVGYIDSTVRIFAIEKLIADPRD